MKELSTTEKLALELANVGQINPENSLKKFRNDYVKHHMVLAKHVQRMVLEARIEELMQLLPMVKLTEKESTEEPYMLVSDINYRLAELRSERDLI